MTTPEYYQENRESIRKSQAEYYQKNRERILIRFHDNKDDRHLVNKTWRVRLRAECLMHYGGKCSCCGEDRYEFLAFDHINGDGSKQRKSVRGGTKFLLWLRANNYPTDIQILCHNCNQAKGFYGYCPHENERSK